MLIVSQLVQGLRNRALQQPFGWRGAMVWALECREARKRRAKSSRSAHGQDSLVRQAVTALRDVGFFAIEDFFSPAQTRVLAEQLRVSIRDNPSLLHPATPYDKRLHGIESLDSTFQLFSRHPLLHDIACSYLEEPADVAFTLGAILEATPSNPGSGGGWHRDSFIRQFKTMVYLSDVQPDDGAFQIIEKSHHFSRGVRDNMIMKQKYGDARMSHDTVMQLLEVSGTSRLHTLSGKAGTVLLFDSSTIHRGSPIRRGERLALTNYFYPVADIDVSLYQHFKPVAGHSA